MRLKEEVVFGKT